MRVARPVCLRDAGKTRQAGHTGAEHATPQAEGGSGHGPADWTGLGNQGAAAAKMWAQPLASRWRPLLAPSFRATKTRKHSEKERQTCFQASISRLVRDLLQLILVTDMCEKYHLR